MNFVEGGLVCLKLTNHASESIMSKGETNMLLLNPFFGACSHLKVRKPADFSCFLLGYRGDYHLHFSLKIV